MSQNEKPFSLTGVSLSSNLSVRSRPPGIWLAIVLGLIAWPGWLGVIWGADLPGGITLPENPAVIIGGQAQGSNARSTGEPRNGGHGGRIEVYTGFPVNAGNGRDGEVSTSRVLKSGVYNFTMVMNLLATAPLELTIEGDVTINCQYLFAPKKIVGVFTPEGLPPRLYVNAGPATIYPEIPYHASHGFTFYMYTDQNYLDGTGIGGGTIVFKTSQEGRIQVTSMKAFGGEGSYRGLGGDGGMVVLNADRDNIELMSILDVNGASNVGRFGWQGPGGNGGIIQLRCQVLTNLGGADLRLWANGGDAGYAGGPGLPGPRGGRGGAIVIEAQEIKTVFEEVSAKGGHGGHGGNGDENNGAAGPGGPGGAPGVLVGIQGQNAPGAGGEGGDGARGKQGVLQPGGNGGDSGGDGAIPGPGGTGNPPGKPGQVAHPPQVRPPDIDGSSRTYVLCVGVEDVLVKEDGSIFHHRGDLSAEKVYAAFSSLTDIVVWGDTLELWTGTPDNDLALMSALYKAHQNLDPGDRFIFYIACHGTRDANSSDEDPVYLVDDKEPRWSREDEGLYLTNVGDTFLDQMVTDDQFSAIFIHNRWPRIEKLFLFDCCMAGGFWGNFNGKDSGDLSVVLNSSYIGVCPEGNYAVAKKDPAGNKLSPMCFAIEKALEEMRGNSTITFNDLYQTVVRKGHEIGLDGISGEILGLGDSYGKMGVMKWQPVAGQTKDHNFQIGRTTAPSIENQPQGGNAIQGAPFTLTVTAVGAPPLRYQWFVENKAIAKATNGSLTLANAQKANAGRYFVVVKNPFGSATSQVAVVTVAPPPKPAPPTGVDASDWLYPTKVVITWNASVGASSYEVWRGTNTMAKSAKLIGSATTNRFENSPPVRGIQYYYWVKAKNATGTSDFSAVDVGGSGTPGADLALLSVAMSLPTGDPRGLHPSSLEYSFMNQGPAAVQNTTYLITVYLSRDPTITSTDIKVGDNGIQFQLSTNKTGAYQATSRGLSYLTIPTNQPAGTYYVGLHLKPVENSPYDPNDKNNWICGNTVVIPPPPPLPPVNFRASDGAYATKVRLTWSSSTGATSYEVWRNTTSASSGAKLVGTSKTTSYDDLTATPKQMYYYWVKSVKLGMTSAFSQTDSGYSGTRP